MGNQWYLRIRGQILGPFSVEKLQEMSQRGELSRIHEVSPDGLSWERASLHPEFFSAVLVPKPPAGNVQPASSAAATAPASPVSPVSGCPTPTEATPSGGVPSSMVLAPTAALSPPGPLWYYSQDGKPVGPIPETELRALLDAGKLSSRVLVWNERLPAWCPAKDAFEYLAKQAFPRPVPLAESASENLPEALFLAAARIRGWTLFLTVRYWMTAFLLLIIGVTSIAVSSRPPFHVPSIVYVLSGIGCLVEAFVWGVYGFSMFNYTSSLRNLQFNRTAAGFHKSLDELYNYFLVKGIIYILGLVFLGIIALVSLILAIAQGSYV